MYNLTKIFSFYTNVVVFLFCTTLKKVENTCVRGYVPTGMHKNVEVFF